MEEKKETTTVENTTVKKEKKKGKVLPIILTIIVLLIAGLGAFVALNFRVAKNTFNKLTKSPEDYCKAVLLERGNKQVKAIGDAYDKFVANGFLADEFSSDSTITFTVTDDAFDLLDDKLSESGVDIDLDEFSFLSKIGAKYSVSKKGSLTSIYINTFDGDGTIIDGQIMFDKDEEMVYIGFPGESDEFMAYSLSDFYDEEDIDELFEIIDKIDEVKNASPSRQQIESLYSKLLKAMVDSINDVDESKDTLEIGELSAKCTVLTINFDEKMVKSMAKAICDFLSDDELEDIIYNYAEIFDEENADDFYDEYEESIEEMRNDADDFEMPEDIEIKLTLYVDNKGNIIGSKAIYEENDEKTEFFEGYIISGSKIACKLTCKSDAVDEEYSIIGEGQVNGDKASIDFKAKVDDFKCDFSFNNVEYKKLSTGVFIGEFELDFKQFKKQLPEDFRNWAIKIAVNSETDSYDISILDKDNLLVELELVVTNSNSSDLSIPDDYTEVEDEADINIFMEDYDFDNLVDFIEAFGVDYADEYVNQAKVAANYIGEIPATAYAFTELLMPNQNVFVTTAFSMTGIMAPQLIKYISKSKVSSDYQLADTIRTAFYTSLMDPEIVNSDCYEDVIDELEYGVNIVDWGEPDNEFEEAVADILAIEDFEELEDMIKSNYSGDGIYVIYSNGSVSVELRNTDSTGGKDTSGYNNISVGY